MLIRQVRAKILARRGELEEAERLACEAIALGEPTDSLEVKADAYHDHALVLAAATRHDEALTALAGARSLYEQKGHSVGVARIDRLRAELAASLGA
jgi:hypothetical protein